MNLKTKSFLELKEALDQGEISSESLTLNFLDQIRKWNPKLNAFIHLNEKALEEAQEADRLLKEKGHQDQKPLLGLPLAFKDMFCTKNLKTTAASKMLKEFVPPYSATLVERLLKRGAINIGKTNQDEFAMGSGNQNSYWGECRNPWNLDCISGGSSGGSAVAVAAGMVPLSFGTDTGGSVRLPASFCGVVGVKPTYGRISRYGMIAYASSLDQAGVFTRRVKDAAFVLEFVCGEDGKDSTCSPKKVPKWTECLDRSLQGLRLGKPKECFEKELDVEIREALEESFQMAKEAGAEVIDVSLPYLDLAIATYYLIATSEASSNLARYDGVRYGYRAPVNELEDLMDFFSCNRGEGFGLEVKQRILIGTYVLSTGYYDQYYKKACQIRRLLYEGYLEVFKKCDVLLTPVTSQAAPSIHISKPHSLSTYLKDYFTLPINLVGLPAMSLPLKLNSKTLPLGVQIIAPHFEEQKMFNVAQALEDRLLFKEFPHVFH